MTVKELRERLERERDDAIVEVYRETIATNRGPHEPAVMEIVGADSYGHGPTGSGAIVLLPDLDKCE